MATSPSRGEHHVPGHRFATLTLTTGHYHIRCLRNVVALFHVVEKENAWRKQSGRSEGFQALKTSKPIVALGAEHPLENEALAADDFHGSDGLHGVHEAVRSCGIV